MGQTPMTKDQLSEKLLAAAKKVGAAEHALATARAEYESLFDEIVGGRNRSGSGNTASEPMAQEAPSFVSASNNGHGPLKVEQKVFRFIREKGTAQDAQSIHEGTGVPVPSVRWAFVKLIEKGVIKKEQRGKYVVADKTETEE
jgi:hypothetical protein